MRAVWLLASHEFSARWRGWLALALLAGLGGAVVLAAVSGARRTASAYPRLLHASRASDVLVSPASTGSAATTARWRGCQGSWPSRHLRDCRPPRSDRPGCRAGRRW